MADPATPLDPVLYYSTVDRVAQDYNISQEDEQHSRISSVLAAATGLMTRACSRSFFNVEETRRYVADHRFPDLPLGDVISIDRVRIADRPGSVDYGSWIELTDYMLLAAETGQPSSGITLTDPNALWPRPVMNRYGQSYPIPNVEARGRYGWMSVPAAVEEGTRLITGRYLTRHKAGFDPMKLEGMFYTDPDVRQVITVYGAKVQAGAPTWHVVQEAA